MFFGCYNLEELNLGYINAENLKNMNYLFALCARLENLKLGFVNTENVEEMRNMFLSCSNLKYLDLSSFNTKNLIKMNSMFSRCQNLISLNLSFFDTSKCQHDNNPSIFQECESLREIIIKKRDLEFFKEELSKSNINIDDHKDFQDNIITISCRYKP